MATKPTNIKAVKDAPEETPAKLTPSMLAKELGCDPKALRSYLRKEFPRNPADKNTSWDITLEQADAARAQFSKDADEATDEA